MKAASVASYSLKDYNLQPVEIIPVEIAREIYPQLNAYQLNTYFVKTVTEDVGLEQIERLKSLPGEEIGISEVPETSQWAIRTLRKWVIAHAKKGDYSHSILRRPSKWDILRRMAIRELEFVVKRQTGFQKTGWDFCAFSNNRVVSTTYGPAGYAGLHFDDKEEDYRSDTEVIRIIINLRSRPRKFVVLPISVFELAKPDPVEFLISRLDLAREALKAHRYAVAIEVPPGSFLYCKTRKYVHDGLYLDYSEPDAAAFFYGYYPTISPEG